MKKTFLLFVFAGALIATSCQKDEVSSPSKNSSSLTEDQSKIGKSINMVYDWSFVGYFPPTIWDNGNLAGKDTTFVVNQFLGTYFLNIEMKANISGYQPCDSLYFYCVKVRTREVRMELLIEDPSVLQSSNVSFFDWGNYTMGIGIDTTYVNPQGVLTDTIVILPSARRLIKAVKPTYN